MLNECVLYQDHRFCIDESYDFANLMQGERLKIIDCNL